MIIFLIILILIITFAAKPSKTALVQSYYSIPQTQAIKGIFVITIFFSHFCSYVHLETWYDKPMQSYCTFLGQLMVAPFLLYSGYGIFESVKAKGNIYIKSFPKKRILKTLLHFDFAIILFLVLDLITERAVSIPFFLLSLIAWESIGNSNWFIFAILCVYIFTFIGLFIFKGKLKETLFVIVTMSIVYMIVVSQFKGNYWIDTILAFPIGCLLSLYKDKIDKALHSKILALGGAQHSCIIAHKSGMLADFVFFQPNISSGFFSRPYISFTLHSSGQQNIKLVRAKCFWDIYFAKNSNESRSIFPLERR